MNGFQLQATVLQKAVADRSGETVEFFIPDSGGMNGTICLGEPASKASFQVETTTLDELVQDWVKLDLIKIDVEGAEERVWQGMQATLAKHKNVTVILEINCGRYQDPKGFLQQIQSVGFSLKHIDFDSKVKELTLDQCFNERINEDWMLFLRREN